MKLACEGNFGIGGRGFVVYWLEKLKQSHKILRRCSDNIRGMCGWTFLFLSRFQSVVLS